MSRSSRPFPPAVRSPVARLAMLAGVCGAITLASMFAVGCNTVKGLGEDIQSAGEAGERAISGDSSSKDATKSDTNTSGSSGSGGSSGTGGTGGTTPSSTPK